MACGACGGEGGWGEGWGGVVGMGGGCGSCLEGSATGVDGVRWLRIWGRSLLLNVVWYGTLVYRLLDNLT